MKKLILVLLSGLLVSVAGCSKKSTTPEQKPTEDYTLQASQTIGSEGGTIEAEDFSLTVPEGAFSSDAELKLYASSKDKPFGDNCVTRTFRLEGLPDDYSKPLPLRIKYQDTLSNESFIGVGGEALIPGSGELKPVYRLFQAADSSGYLYCELPAMGPGKAPLGRQLHKSCASSGGALEVYFAGQTGYDPPHETAHFKIIFPSDLVGHSKYFLPQTLEEAYDTLKALGFSLDLVPLPMEVYMLNFPQQDSGRYCMFFPAWGVFSLVFDERALRDLLSYQFPLKAATIRELAHSVFCTYDKNYFNVLLFHQVRVNPTHYWLHHAAASWFEEKLVPYYGDVGDFSPLDFEKPVDNRLAPFKGMQAGAKGNEKGSLNHGGGMSAMIKYLSLEEHYRESVLFRIYEGIKNKMHPVQAVFNSVDDTVYLWWPDFFKEYVSGSIYGVPYNKFTYSDATSGTFNISSEKDTLKTFSGSYPDLSAKIYEISLRYTKINTIRFKVSSSDVGPNDVTIMVFGCKDGSLQYFVHAAEEVTVPNVRDLMNDGYGELYAVVVNSSCHTPVYTQESDIDLTVRVTMSKLPYTYCEITVDVMGHLVHSTGEEDTLAGNWFPFEATGSFSGNTFTGSGPDWWGSDAQLTMTVTVDPTDFSVLTFNATYFASNVSVVVTRSVSGTDLPVKYHDYDRLECEVSGEGTCGHISSLEYRSEAVGSPYWVELTDYWCDSYSKANIRFLADDIGLK